MDLGRGRNRLGGSILAQAFNQLGDAPADVENAQDLKNLFAAVQQLNQQEKILAYHDRSDGGLLATLCEMVFAARCSMEIDLTPLAGATHGLPPGWAALFNEEIGVVLQIRAADQAEVTACFAQYGLADCTHVLGHPSELDGDVRVLCHGEEILWQKRATLQQQWSAVSFHMQALRDNPDCAAEEYLRIADAAEPGLFLRGPTPHTPALLTGARPRIAILREQGVNGQVEMAAAFDRAGFTCVDVHGTDILAGRVSLSSFQGMAACGGFSFGDVLGAGGGWATTIRYNARAFDEFSAFFQRTDTLTLGVCNGCQMLSQLNDLIPGAQHWPRFVRNRSEQFEARLVMVEIPSSPSLFMTGMAGWQLPVVVSHGEGRALFANEHAQQHAIVALRYTDALGQPATRYPANPNGSPDGITGLTTPDGRFTILMPHPERLFLTSRYSWLPPDWHAEEGPWMHMFHNARHWF